MPLEDGAYDIISRKYSVPLGLNELESPSQLLVYRVAARESGPSTIPWDVEVSPDGVADADAKVISFTGNERTVGANGTPAPDTRPVVKSTTYRCPDTSIAKAKDDRCTTWIIKEARSTTAPGSEIVYYTISDSEGRLWKLTGGVPGSRVAIEAPGHDDDLSAYHFEFKKVTNSV